MVCVDTFDTIIHKQDDFHESIVQPCKKHCNCSKIYCKKRDCQYYSLNLVVSY